MKNRTKLLDLYKSYYHDTYIYDEDNEEVFDEQMQQIVIENPSVDFTHGLIYEIANLAIDADIDLQYAFDNYEEMTFEYYLNWSGGKYISPLYERYLEIVDNDLERADKEIARIIFNRYKLNWSKRYGAILEDYKPLENYNMNETRRDNIDVTEDLTSDDDVYGYNSSTPSPSDKNHSVKSTTGDAEDNYRSTTRSGNIGVTTSQKMLAEELEIRKYDFIESIYKDIDRVVVLSVY